MMDKEVIRETVHETLEALGIDTDNIQQTQADMLFLRRQRQASEEMSKWVKRSTVGILVAGFLVLMWEGFKHIK